MQKNHHRLVCGSVMFRTEDMQEGEIGKLELNGLLSTKNKDVTFTELQMAQQVLQQHLITKLQAGAEEGQVVSPMIIDVFISNLVYLGYMTDADFAPKQQSGPVNPDPVEIPRSLQ
jgi:hypothetical protein